MLDKGEFAAMQGFILTFPLRRVHCKSCFEHDGMDHAWNLYFFTYLTGLRGIDCMLYRTCTIDPNISRYILSELVHHPICFYCSYSSAENRNALVCHIKLTQHEHTNTAAVKNSKEARLQDKHLRSVAIS